MQSAHSCNDAISSESPNRFREYCDPCRSFLSSHPKARPRLFMAEEHIFPYNHHGSLDELRACATRYHDPCKICVLVFDQMHQYSHPGYHDARSVHIKLEHHEQGRSFTMCIGLKRLDHHLVDPCASLHVQGLDCMDVYPRMLFYCLLIMVTVASYDLMKDLGISTCSPESVKLAESWLQTCLQEHQQCRLTKIETKDLPTRLVEVHGERNARLVISSSLVGRPPYLTLSHCWGKSKFMTLTRETIGKMIVSIKVNKLAHNFQDAIKITFQLGYKYIWIDSLCIIQDSREDWASEAALMSHVYQNSTLTIAATAASSAFDGFFRNRPRPPIFLSSSPFSEVPSERIVIDIGDSSRQRFAVRNCVLQTRGWILQEELLSPRILHFGPHGLLWECEQHSATELEPLGMMRCAVEDKRSVHNPFASSLLSNHAPMPWNKTNPWDLTWASIVRDFTERSLTHDSDKLVALSGVSRMVKSKLKDSEYLAGLWSHDILVGICWSTARRFDQGVQHSRPSVYRAPTWSWASIDGSVTMRRFHFGPRSSLGFYSEVIETSITLATRDTFGEVTGGFLRISGILLPSSIILQPVNEYKKGREDFVDLDENETPEWLQFRWKRCTRSVFMDIRGAQPNKTNEIATFLTPVFSQVNKDKDGNIHSTELYMLVLEPAKPMSVSCEPAYQRIGLVSVLDLGIPPDPFWTEQFPRHSIVIF